MTALADAPQSMSVGFLQAWESETSYPDETPVISDLAWARPPEARPGPTWLRGFTIAHTTPAISSHVTAGLPNDMGRVWLPWAFTPANTSFGIVVSSIGLGAIASGTVLAIGGGVGAGATTVLPASGVLSLMNPGQITVFTTSLWDEVDEIRLLAPGLLPRMLRVRETPWEQLSRQKPDPRLSDAVAAIDDLMRWLSLGQDEIADICHFSLRASRYWGSGKTKVPRPTTVRRLHEVHALVGSLVRTVGRQRARDWLDQSGPAGERRLDVLAGDGGVSSLLREASRLLFAEAPRPERPRPESLDAAESARSAEAYAPMESQGPVRRPRRVPHRGE
jgi:hypothetical protein